MKTRDSLLRVLGFAYGLLTLSIYVAVAILDGSAFRRSNSEEEEELTKANARRWDLANPPFDLTHRFHKAEDGVQTHYVSTGLQLTQSPTNLVILLHGFPDSWALWLPLMRRDHLFNTATLAALDLPGYGGSQSLPRYGATEMLEAVTKAIIGIRDQYLSAQEGGSVVLVGHDWGGLIASRLAAEAPQVADRFIIINTVYPSLALTNVSDRWHSARRLLYTAYSQTSRAGALLRGAWKTLSPVLTQLRKSGYVFVFNLPWPLPQFLGRLGNHWFLRACHRGSVDGGRETAEVLASSLGPDWVNSRSRGIDGEMYDSSVAERQGEGGWATKIRIYSEGLTTGKWEKSLDTVTALWNLESSSGSSSKRRPSTASAGLFEDGNRAAFHAPVTMVWGKDDVALDRRIALEGMADAMVRNSQVVELEGVGHWLPRDEKGVEVLGRIVAWALDGGDGGGKIAERLQGMDGVKVKVEK